MGARLRSWWAGATFGAAHPGRRVAALAVLGTITGAGEALVVLLLVALVAGGESRLPGLIGPAETWTLAGFALLSTVVLAASHFAAAWTSARAATDAQRRVQGLLIDAFLAAPYADQRGARTGELQELVMGRARMVALGTAEAARAISTTANLLIVVVAAILVDVRATVVLLVAVAFAVAIARPFQARTRRMARESVQAYGTLATGVTETASLAPELRVFDATDPARERVGRNLDAARRLTEAVQLATTATPQLTRDATIAVLVVGMAVLVSSADVPIAVLGAAIVLVLRALAHAQALVGSLQRLADRAANLQPVLDRLAQWRPAAAAGTRPCPRVGTVELQGVTFTHRPGDPEALRDVDLRLEAGELCGIVGPTGAGKSTLAGIVLGLLAPDGGRVLVDGVPLGELAPHEWYRHTAWVGQDPRLLTGTVRENIRFLRPGVDDEAVERAARAAALEPDLAGWPEGLDHPVGSAGASLSGGQRQRVALARALVGRPSLVVLDEPTSALDAHAEAAVRDALAALRGHATVVVIAHRISTIRSCDRLVVLRGGRLVTAGPPDVVAREDPYVADVLALAAGDRPR